METIEENNKMIAEFMKFQLTELGWYDENEVMSEYACQIVGGNTFEELQYDRSWDWLMPVVEKIENLGYEFFVVENRYSIHENTDSSIKRLMYAEGGTKLEITYHGVVEFINWYNKNK